MNSLWLTENKNNSKFESLSKNINTDVCIIGAGIFGMTCGYYLSKAGLNVSIIEKNEIGHKTTGHTTAKITSQHGLFYTIWLKHMVKVLQKIICLQIRKLLKISKI